MANWRKSHSSLVLFIFHTIIFLWVKSSDALNSSSPTLTAVFSRSGRNADASVQDKKSSSIPVLTSDSCDWYGSGLDTSFANGSVVPVYLRCLQGVVHWTHVQDGSGLIVVLSHDKDFKGCIRVSRSTSAQVSISLISGGKVVSPSPSPTASDIESIFHTYDGLEHDLLRCFTSNDRKATVLIESFPPTVTKDAKSHVNYPYRPLQFKMDYHLEPREENGNEVSACRPCNDNELLQTFCSSEFVLRGTILSTSDNYPLFRSDLSVNVVQVIRNSTSPLSSDIPQVTEDAIVILHRPIECHPRHSPPQTTEFLFMGHWILGSPVVKCAPKWTHWKRLRHDSIHSGSSPCHLWRRTNYGRIIAWWQSTANNF